MKFNNFFHLKSQCNWRNDISNLIMAGKLEQYSNVPVMTQSRVLHIVELTPPNKSDAWI